MDRPREVFTEEIRDLEAKLELKKRELAESGGEAVPERKIFAEVVREHANTETGGGFSAAWATGVPSSSARKPTAEEERVLAVLVERAFTKSIRSAVAEARKTGDAYVIDAFHDRLADEYYQKLLEARKLAAPRR